MTYEELNATMPGTLFRVKGGAYNYMFLQGVCPHDRTIRVEMNGVNQRVDPIRAKSAVLLCTTRL